MSGLTNVANKRQELSLHKKVEIVNSIRSEISQATGVELKQLIL